MKIGEKPWKYNPDYDSIEDECGRVVADGFVSEPLLVHAVACVNMHDDLVASVEELLGGMEQHWAQEHESTVKQICQLLKEAKAVTL